MRALLLNTDWTEAQSIADDLVAAGHEVARCFEPDGAGFACAALTEHHSCPLDGALVDVAISVHPTTTDPNRGTGTDDGARCALRHHIPLVLAGDHTGSSLADWATATTPLSGSLVATVERAAHAPLPDHEEAAVAAFRETLGIHQLGTVDPAASVTRDQGRLRVELRPSEPIPAAVEAVASVRVAAAIRALDRHARSISISIVPQQD